MAQRAQAITRRHFGRTISLYTPLYLSNYCNGGCLYCGIAADRRAVRAVLNANQLDRELDAITQAGLDEIVLPPVNACPKPIQAIFAKPSNEPLAD